MALSPSDIRYPSSDADLLERRIDSILLSQAGALRSMAPMDLEFSVDLPDDTLSVVQSRFFAKGWLLELRGQDLTPKQVDRYSVPCLSSRLRISEISSQRVGDETV
jgi:hypothetical protein